MEEDGERRSRDKGREREREWRSRFHLCVSSSQAVRAGLRVSQSLLQTFPASTTAALRCGGSTTLAPDCCCCLHQKGTCTSNSRLAPKRQQFWPKLNETFTKGAAGTVHQDPEPKWDFETPAIPPIEYSGHFGARVLSLA